MLLSTIVSPTAIYTLSSQSSLPLLLSLSLSLLTHGFLHHRTPPFPIFFSLQLFPPFLSPGSAA